MKITQISATSSGEVPNTRTFVFGLGDDGNVYQWNPLPKSQWNLYGS